MDENEGRFYKFQEVWSPVLGQRSGVLWARIPRPLDQFRANGYPYTEHPASFLDLEKEFEYLPEDKGLSDEEEVEGEPECDTRPNYVHIKKYVTIYVKT